MFETFAFPVQHCPCCARDVVAGVDVDDLGELVTVCTRCGEPLTAAAEARLADAATLTALGYDVESEGESRGCGTGGGGCGGGCGSTCAA